ncbi:MAG: SDR family oxidoreductase [Leptolinea sp.]|nr:SDR family oxidoreductase [Leptolinea sp.]
MTEGSPHYLNDLKGKIALITGAGAGIGAGIARRFALAGADVAVCDLKPSPAISEYIVSTGQKSFFHPADVSDPAQVAALFDAVSSQFGVPDILVNNAGIYPNASVLQMTPEEWDQTINIDLKSVFLCTQAAAQRMIEGGKSGSIVNIGSIDATNPLAAHSHYSAAKAGVIAFTRAAAQELGPHGIRVNSVSPGLINRPGLAEAWPDGYNRFMHRVPTGRLGEPEDIADACIFLASDAARWISGTNLIVDGGVQACPMF